MFLTPDGLLTVLTREEWEVALPTLLDAGFRWVRSRAHGGYVLLSPSGDRALAELGWHAKSRESVVYLNPSLLAYLGVSPDELAR